MTNGDMFRSMSDVEIAAFMFDFLDCCACPIRDGDCENDCNGTWLAWLKEETE